MPLASMRVPHSWRSWTAPSGAGCAWTSTPWYLDQLPARNRARAHLLGRQLGGSGDLPANLVALYQTRANTPVMRDYESAVADAVRAGETVRYRVRPRYPSPGFEGAPSAIRITAAGDRGFRLDVTIANTPQATVTEASVAAADPTSRGAQDAGAAGGAAAATG
jgi:hypothetical protein